MRHALLPELQREVHLEMLTACGDSVTSQWAVCLWVMFCSRPRGKRRMTIPSIEAEPDRRHTACSAARTGPAPTPAAAAEAPLEPERWAAFLERNGAMEQRRRESAQALQGPPAPTAPQPGAGGPPVAPDGVYKRIAGQKSEKELLLEHLRRQKDEEELAPCTFAPQLISKGPHDKSPGGAATLYERAQKREQRRAERERLARSERELREAEECRFQPEFFTKPGRAQVAAPEPLTPRSSAAAARRSAPPPGAQSMAV
ncbi:unnamed protein product, partial [Prorocentrum cordatum]